MRRAATTRRRVLAVLFAAVLAGVVPAGAAGADDTSTADAIDGVITGTTEGGSGLCPPTDTCEVDGEFGSVEIAGSFMANGHECVANVAFTGAGDVAFHEEGNIAVAMGHLPGGEDFAGANDDLQCTVDEADSQITEASTTCPNDFVRVGLAAVATPCIDLGVTDLLGNGVDTEIQVVATVTAIPGANPGNPGDPTATLVVGNAGGARG